MFEDEENDIDILSLLERYEGMVKKQQELFFDVDEFEALSDYYYDSGKLSKAIKVVEMASGQHPGCSTFLLKKAHYYTAGNNLKKAKAELDKLEQTEPVSFEFLMARAALFSKQNKHQQAIDVFKKAIPLADFPEDVWPLLAMEYQMMGNYQLALKYLKLTLDENPDDEIAVYNIALCFDLLEKAEEGISYFKRFIESNPYNEVAWYHLGLLHGKCSDYDEALRALDYAILIDEYFTAAYYEKARILEKTFRYQEAADAYQASFEFDGATGYSYYKIGLCYLKMHKHNKAENYFTKAVHEDADLDEAFYELALIKDEQNLFEEAIYHIEKALDLDNENWDYLFASADIHRRAGRLNEAEHIYKNLIELGYMEPDVYIDYGELMFDLCEFEEGMEILYQGVTLNPDSADMNYRLAGYLYTLQENDEADIYFKKALDLDPDRKIFFFNLFPKLKNHASIRKILAG